MESNLSRLADIAEIKSNQSLSVSSISSDTDKTLANSQKPLHKLPLTVTMSSPTPSSSTMTVVTSVPEKSPILPLAHKKSAPKRGGSKTLSFIKKPVIFKS
jgi:hypothetical protein